MNLPNALTILRIFFVPLLVAALVQETGWFQVGGVRVTNDWLSLGIFLVAAFTDLLDGYLARRWKQVTTIGTLLDPIADKLLISAALISLVQIHCLPGWMAVLIIGRAAERRAGASCFSPWFRPSAISPSSGTKWTRASSTGAAANC